MRVGLPADVKEKAVKTSGVVRFDNKVEVLLKMTGTTVQEPAAQKGLGETAEWRKRRKRRKWRKRQKLQLTHVLYDTVLQTCR